MRQFLALLLTILFFAHFLRLRSRTGTRFDTHPHPHQHGNTNPDPYSYFNTHPSPAPCRIGLRPENAATQTYENGTPVQKTDGQVTATWSEDEASGRMSLKTSR